MSTQKKLPHGNKDIVFRRVNGRIIPIRKKPNKEQVQGAALVGAGAATVALGAEGAAQAVKRSAAMRIRAKFDFNRLYSGFKRSGKAAQGAFSFMRGKRSRVKGMEEAIRTRAKSANLFKTRHFILSGAAAIGGALMSAGLNRIQRNGGQLETGQEIAGTSVAAAAATAGSLLYYRRLGLRNVSFLRRFASARKSKSPRPFQIPIKFKKGGALGKGGTLKF